MSILSKQQKSNLPSNDHSPLLWQPSILGFRHIGSLAISRDANAAILQPALEMEPGRAYKGKLPALVVDYALEFELEALVTSKSGIWCRKYLALSADAILDVLFVVLHLLAKGSDHFVLLFDVLHIIMN